MGSFITIISALSSITTTIKAIESAVPDQGQGSAKLEAVIGILGALNPALQPLTAELSPVVSTLVTLFNKTNAWGK